ncbi:MAG: serine hydrolase [Alphaproteobacteria bacterium]|nr:serine hydrolase [Alphaproteobacteria bacterium]
MDRPTIKPRTARELGIMQGFPAVPEKRPTLLNWDLPPFNRWSFMNMRKLFPTADVKTSYQSIQPLSYDLQPLLKLSYKDAQGEDTTIANFLDRSYTDGFIVLHKGRIIHESYANDMTEVTPHLSQSVAKSVVGSLAGILVEQGLVDINAPLVTYIPELAQCGYKDALLEHALCMTSGVRFTEDYNLPQSDMTRIDIASGWRPVPEGEKRLSIREVILTLPKIREHGEIFNYRSIETDVVAWALERATNKSLADLTSEYIWKKIGAEQDSFFTVDNETTALADGGFNATLRDYARFGLMMQNDGYVGDQQVVPTTWVDACATGDKSIYGDPYTQTCPNGAYSNFWWVNNIEEGDFMARGVFGQMIYVNRRTETTIVKLSTWPDYLIQSYTVDALKAFAAILKVN